MYRTGISFSSGARRFALLAVFASLSGCSFYNKPYPTPNVHEQGYDLRVVQVDDFGSLWDPKEAGNTLRALQEVPQNENLLVVIFIHGWHHNASAEDENLLQFKETMAALRAAVDAPQRSVVREAQTGSSKLHLVGIYVGWRGKSLPLPLDYATMWWRKSAAERVGDGDISEFVERLDGIYLRRNASAEGQQANQRPFMGLVTIGHSFGAQVLFKSIARALEYPLVQRAPCEAQILAPNANTSNRTMVQSPVDSLGDLNILVNPALEAYQFARIDALYRQLSFSYTQTPQLVVFSADNDVPRQTYFPIGRAVDRPFRPGFRSDHDDYQGALWGTALGDLPQQQTHSLDLSTAPDSLSDSDYGGPQPGKTVREFDFSGETVFGGVKLARLAPGASGGPAATANSPVVVAVTHDKIIDGHNGIFEPVFRNFLVEYVAYIEGKRFLLRSGESAAHRSAPGSKVQNGNATPPTECNQ